MDLKPSLEDYTEAEFLAFLKKIWAVNVSEAEHDRLVMHFDAVSGHPMGADALFFGEDQGRRPTPEIVLSEVNSWARYTKRQGLKDPCVSPPAQHQPKPSRFPAAPAVSKGYTERAAQRQANAAARPKHLPMESKAAELDRLEHIADENLNRLEWIMATVSKPPSGGDLNRQLDQLQEDVAEVDAAWLAARGAVAHVNGRAFGFNFDRQQAESAVKYPRRGQDPAVLQLNLQTLVQFQQQHQHRWAVVLGYQEALRRRYRQFTDESAARTAQLETATGRDPALIPSEIIISLGNAASGPCVVGPNPSAMKGFERITTELSQRLLQARATLLGKLEDPHNQAGIFTEVFYFSKTLGHGERYALSLPIKDLALDPDRDWATTIGQEVNLAFRLFAARKLEQDELYKQVNLVATRGLPSTVRVREAKWDPFHGGYRFTTAQPGATTFVWMHDPAPAQESFLPNIMGTTARVPFNRVADEGSPIFDDYIICFPPSAGVAPLYLLHKKPVAHRAAN